MSDLVQSEITLHLASMLYIVLFERYAHIRESVMRYRVTLHAVPRYAPHPGICNAILYCRRFNFGSVGSVVYESCRSLMSSTGLLAMWQMRSLSRTSLPPTLGKSAALI